MANWMARQLTLDLAAFATALDRRRADYHVLLKTLSFPRPSGDIPPAFDEFGNETRDKLVSIEDSHLMVCQDQELDFLADRSSGSAI